MARSWPATTLRDDAFVKEPEPDVSMSQSLTVELLARLEGHHKKTLHLTGDRNGLNASAGSKRKSDGTWITLFDEFADVFIKAGWMWFYAHYPTTL